MSEPRKIEAIDIKLNEAKSKGTAFYRLDANFKDFLSKCFKEGIVGFEYEEGSWNFGIILEDKNEGK
jgi:hypothetical protein